MTDFLIAATVAAYLAGLAVKLRITGTAALIVSDMASKRIYAETGYKAGIMLRTGMILSFLASAFLPYIALLPYAVFKEGFGFFRMDSRAELSKLIN